MTVNNPQLDATNKLRTSSPQALIDTDFEYGTQGSKWENLSTTNLRPYAYNTGVSIGTTITNMATTAGSRVVTVTGTGFKNAAGSALSASDYGTPIVIQDALLPTANGVFAIDTSSTPSATNFSYVARAAASTTTSTPGILDANKTQINLGTYYSNAGISISSATVASNVVRVTTSAPHGLSVGNEIQITGTTASTLAPNGTWVVTGITSPTQFSFVPPSAPTGTITGGTVYARPQGVVLHRPFDGGVIFSSNGSSNYESQVRQTRRYFRYQSGKGIQMSSGTILKPNFQLDGLQYATSGNVVTATTKDQHNLQSGSVITVYGADQSLFNGTFTVYTVTGSNSFTYVASGTNPTALTASGNYYATVAGWYGAVNRLGIFDQQNGLFFEFDGQQLYAVRRNSTYQISGRINVNSGSTTVTGNSLFPTTFSNQLAPGDFIVIRGASYRVDAIASDTSLTISPAFRGASNITAAVVSKTIDTKIPQSSWNLDPMDGTGPSGYKLDLTKMQMFYIDFSWYGAGFIRWGLRGTDGDVTYVHKMQNNNVNAEAYMRSGNLPARYESTTLPAKTTLTASVTTSDSTIKVASTTGFASSGTLVIKGASNYEYVNYAGTTPTSFTGLTRMKVGATSDASISPGGTGFIPGSLAGIQVGQRAIFYNSTLSLPDGTYVSSINTQTGTVNLSQAATGVDDGGLPQLLPLDGLQAGSGTGPKSFTYSATAPIAVEQAFPTFAPTISHWGTSVIMDGRFDDDKSLLFTYGQTATTSVAANASVALMSIRVAPSVDNGKAAAFGARDLVNRMQLVLRALDISMTQTATTQLLVTAVLNGTPSTATTWAPITAPTSSLAQIADYSGGSTTITGGEITGGFFVATTGSIDLGLVRDLGNSVLGGGTAVANTGIYPDGPDVLTIVVKNVGANTATVLSRLSWTEAQA